MTIVVGYGPEDRGHGALQLARMLATSAGVGLVVCCVIPDRWQSVGPGRQVDRDYEEYLRGLATDSLDHAAALIGDLTVPVTYDVLTSRSAPSGLLLAAERFDATVLVVGSSSHGAWGHVALGSVTDRLLHSSQVSRWPPWLPQRGWTAGRARHGGG